MKRKINIQLLGLSIIAMFATLFMVIGVFYKLFRSEVIGDLKAYTRVLANLKVFEAPYDTYSIREDNLRVSLIDTDGTVLFDSYKDAHELCNHKDRPEVKEAFKKGEGSSIRKSDTMDKDTFYYTVKLSDGKILRLAKEANSVWSIFSSALPTIIGITLLLIMLCIILARIMTRNLITPIETIANNLEECESISTYKEIMPFITMIQKQHNDIIKSADIRQEFTANVSHELKTPLTAISGYAELIENGMATEEDMIRFAREIHQNSNRLLMLINDIIQLSELDTNHINYVFEPVDIYEIAKTCIRTFKINADENEVTLNLEGESCIINGSRKMLEEVIYNLCDNAIRYNNKGGSVYISIYKEDGKSIFKVRDTGIGISKEHQERIFERFYRVDKSRTKAKGGTGLGLAIVKHALSNHKADLILSSEKGKGTEIKVIFKE